MQIANKQYSNKVVERVNKELDIIINKATKLIQLGIKPPDYFSNTNVTRSLSALKNYPWFMDEQIRGIKDAGYGFVIKLPQLHEYSVIEPWQEYFKRSVASSQIYILGGGEGLKEIGLLNQFAKKNNVIIDASVTLTDLKNPSEKIKQQNWGNISKVLGGILDLNDLNVLYNKISKARPDIVTLISVLSIFPIRQQEKILLAVYQALPSGGELLYGSALPATPVNFFGHSISKRADKVIKSAYDFFVATLINSNGQYKQDYLFEAEKLEWSTKGKMKFRKNASFNLEWSLWITGQLDRLRRVGYKIKSVSLKGVKGKFGFGRPKSLSPYITVYASKDKNINLKMIEKIKSTKLLCKNTGIKLVPITGNEGEIYQKWFNRKHYAEEMKWQHSNTPYTTNSRYRENGQVYIDFMFKSPHHALFKIIHPKYGFIGHISLNSVNYEDLSCGSIGIHIGEKRYWGKGIGKIVMGLIIEKLKKFKFKCLYNYSNINNLASCRINDRYFERVKIENNLIYYKKEIV